MESGTHSEFRESAPPPQSRLPVVLDVVCGHRRVGDPVVDDGVHAHCHRVSGEDLMMILVVGDYKHYDDDRDDDDEGVQRC